MSTPKITGSQDQPSTARRALLTGGVAGLAAVAGATLGGAEPASALTNPSITDWINVVTDVSPGADPTGKNDSASAINTAIGVAAGQPTGGVVYLPTGTYKVGKPLVLKQGVFLVGANPAWPAAGTVTADLAGTIIKPTSGFDGSAFANKQPGVIYVNGDNTTIYRMGVANLWIDAGNCNVGIHGFSAWGGCFHGALMNFGVRNAAQDGFHFQQDNATPTPNRPDGWSIRDCMVEGWNNKPVTPPPYAYGIWWHGQDTQFINVHVQQAPPGTTDHGCWWIDNGNNCLWLGCRGDQGVYGWVFDSNPGGASNVDTPGSTQRLIACGTENTYHQALWLNNTNDPQMRTPVNAIGCSFDYAGRDGLSTTPAVQVTGYNLLVMRGCNVTCNGPGFYPQVGLATEAGSGGGVAALIDIDGGMWNVMGTKMVSDGPPAAALMRYRFYGYAGTNIVAGTLPTKLTLFQNPGTWP